MKRLDPLTKKMFNKTIMNQKKTVTSRLGEPQNSEKQSNPDSIDCRLCIHFKVTWKKNTPYSCQAYGFMSLQLPSNVVMSTSGQPCMYYKKK